MSICLFFFSPSEVEKKTALVSREPLVEGVMWIMNLYVYKLSLICTEFVKVYCYYIV